MIQNNSSEEQKVWKAFFSELKEKGIAIPDKLQRMVYPFHTIYPEVYIIEPDSLLFVSKILEDLSFIQYAVSLETSMLSEGSPAIWQKSMSLLTGLFIEILDQELGILLFTGRNPIRTITRLFRPSAGEQYDYNVLKASHYKSQSKYTQAMLESIKKQIKRFQVQQMQS